MVIGGIESKVFNLILLTVIALTVAFLLISKNQSKMLSAITSETSARQEQATSGIISDAMNQITQISMTSMTDMEAQIVDDMFQDIQARVKLVADYAAIIFADPDAYPAKPYKGPDASLDGQLVAQMIWPDGVDPDDPAIAARAGLVANISELMISLCDATESDNVFVGVPEGFFLSVNKSSADWFQENGEVLNYDARTRFWYKQALEAGDVVFSDLEVDATTGEMSVVCAMPVYDSNGELAAVVGSDLFLHAMEAVMQRFVTDGGYCWIVNRDGHVIYSPNPEVIQMSESSTALDLRMSENKELASLINDAMSAQTEVRVVDVKDVSYYMLGTPLKTVGWTLFSAFPKEAVDQTEISLLESYEQITSEARTTYHIRFRQRWNSSLIMMGLLSLLALVGAILIGKHIVKPLNTITQQITSLDEQNPEFQMEDVYRTGDEVEVLAESFANLSHKTVEYVEEVKRVTAEKERIGTELHMAKLIQEGMLPTIFPPYPDRREFDLYACMNPAKEVGGDFYDFFLIDDDHLALVIADVSGKGVPAALFMMATKIILKSSAMPGGSLSDILAKTNKTICSNNPMQMFVTVWMGILEVSTGRLTAANAGHEYPVIKRADGTYELFKDKHSFVIGGMDGMKYKEYTVQFQPGDKLFLYTDGVPEATNAQGELFGTDRMIAALNETANVDSKETLAGIRRAVDVFVGEAEQFDDLTMMCLEYKGI